MIKAVLFDMDGVLVNSFNAWLALINDTARHFGYNEVSRASFLSVYGQSTERDVKSFFPGRTTIEIDTYYADHFHEHSSQVEIAQNAIEVLERSKAYNLKFAVITNTSGELARKIIRDLGITIEIVIGGDEITASKPAPDIVYRACELLEVSPSEAIVVGDSIYDMQAAASAGSLSVGVNGIRGNQTIAGLEELPELLEALGVNKGK